LAIPGPSTPPPPPPDAVTLPPDAPLAIPAEDAGFSPEPAPRDGGAASPSGLQPLDTPAGQPVDGPLPMVAPAERLAPAPAAPASGEAAPESAPLAIPADAE
jgi:hypothetical protein